MLVIMTQHTQRLAIAGDVHGDADRLARALDVLLADSELHIVFTGDYVNRGPDSQRVLNLLIDAREAHPGGITLLRGNHEKALLAYLEGGGLSDFAAHGGLATVNSYLGVVRSGALDEFKDTFPLAHRILLESLVAFYEDDDLLVSHTGFNPADPWARTPEALYSAGNPDLFQHRGPWPKPLTVCGHYVQQGRRPHDSPHLVCLDTGCGTLPDAPLTVLTLPARKFSQF
jgi:serine/threonine protein phosphatase 1